MITITNVGSKHGYSGYDHLIDDGLLTDCLGQRYASVRALRAAVQACQHQTADRRVAHVPIWVEIRLATGETREIEA